MTTKTCLLCSEAEQTSRPREHRCNYTVVITTGLAVVSGGIAVVDTGDCEWEWLTSEGSEVD